MTEDRSGMFTASFDGSICYWNMQTGVATLVKGKGHQNQIQRMCCQGDKLITCAMDDTVRFVSVKDLSYT